jgi:predicted phage terminase large subunit-like protein
MRNLTTPQLADLLDQLKDATSKKGKVVVPESPARLAEQLSKGEWYSAPHLELLSSWLTEAVNGERKRILVSMPPRHGKSELISFWLPLWFLAKFPKGRVMLASYEADFAATWGRRVRNAITYEYGEDLGIAVDESSHAADRWNLTSGGGMTSAGAGGSLTGRGANLLIIDDPIKNSEEAASEVIREKLWEWFKTTAFSRLEPGAPCIIVATRWHEDDLIGRLEREGRKDNGVVWDVMKFPAIATEEDILGRKPGEALWPARYDEKAMDEIKRINSPYNWSALYQQNPTPEEGGGVKRSWWKFYKTAPSRFDVVIQAWDMAVKDKETNDFTVGQVWGRKGSEFYLLHQIRERMNMPDILQAMRNLTALYPQAVAKVIEDAASGPAVIAMLQKEVSGMIPWPPKGARRADKGVRLNAVTPLIAAGNVYLPENMDGTKPYWVGEFMEECAAFPNGTHDDQLDAMVHGLTYMQPSAWSFIAKEEAMKKRPKEPETTEELRRQEVQRSIKRWTDKKARQVNSRNELGLSRNIYKPS